MKGRSFARRVRFALAGLRHAAWRERSFRTQIAAAVTALGLSLWLQPSLVWQALILVMVVLVLAAELINTALELTLDGLHPDHAEFVRDAKDCAAAAVLMLSAGAVCVFLLMMLELWQMGRFQ